MAQVQDPPISSARSGIDRRTSIALTVFLAWTLFVWVGRIRNALSDPELTSSERIGPLLLALSFVLPAVALAAALISARRHGAALSGWARTAALVLAGWTTVVWVLRAVDIAFGGDHEAAFVAVHVVLATVSIALAAWVAAQLSTRSPVAGARSRTARHRDTESR